MLPTNQQRTPDLSDRRPHLTARDRTFALVTSATAVLYLGAAILHWGVRIPLGPIFLAFPAAIPPASVVEAAIGIALAAGAVAPVARWRRATTVVRAAYAFAVVGTLFGLTIALLRHLPAPDIWVHVAMLIGLAAGIALMPRTRPWSPA
jgi:hypothetical protein